MNKNDDVLTSEATLNHPAWRTDGASGRLRISEAEAYALHTILLDAEKDTLGAYHRAVASGDPIARQLRHLARRLERVRRRVRALIAAKDWNAPQ